MDRSLRRLNSSMARFLSIDPYPAVSKNFSNSSLDIALISSWVGIPRLSIARLVKCKPELKSKTKLSRRNVTFSKQRSGANPAPYVFYPKALGCVLA
jgi:hypothetical protein